MNPAQLFLLPATLAFAGGVVQSILALRAGHWARNRWQGVLMALGLCLQTAFLYFRGQEVGQCPMKSVPDLLVFIAWSMVLLYFLVGPAYRLSLLGMFTAPLVTGLHILAAFLPDAWAPYPPKGVIDPLVELHAAVALVAYAAFAMACVTGVMFVLQERLLKRHQIGRLFFQLPPIRELATAIQRLVWLGVILLSVSLALSFALENPASGTKLAFAWAIWALYFLAGLAMWLHVMSPRQTALLAVAGFMVPLISLWLVL